MWGETFPVATEAARAATVAEAAAQAEREREQRRAADRHRRDIIQRGESAARRAGADLDAEPVLRLLIWQLADLATQAPIIRVDWTTPGSATRRIASGFSVLGLITAPAFASLMEAAVGAHELGHARTSRGGGPLHREVTAWRWARTHAAVWTRDSDTKMRYCLGTYLKAELADPDKTDLVGVRAIERFLDEPWSARWPSTAEIERVQAEVFAERYSPRCCQARTCLETHARPIGWAGSIACCAQCLPLQLARLDAHSPAQAQRRAARAALAQRDTVRAAVDLEQRDFQEDGMERITTAVNHGMGEVATSDGRRGARELAGAIGAALGSPDARCSTCGRRATRIQTRRGGGATATCDDPLCRENAALDRQAARLQRDRERATIR